MKEVVFKDRIPTHAGKIKLTPVDGAPDEFIMERADDPTVEGTPLNKATFDSVIHSRLTGRYYEPTVTSRRVWESSVRANPIPTSGWTNATSTGAKNGGYELIASPSYGSSYYPNKAVDGDIQTSWISSGSDAPYIIIKFPEPILIKKIFLDTRFQSGNPSCTFWGGNDTGEWTQLLSWNGAVSKSELTLEKTGEYSRYKLSVDGTSQIYVDTFEVSEFSAETISNDFVIENGVPIEWSYEQRIMLKISDTTSSFGVGSNTLNGVPVNMVLQPSKRYELIYNGASFDAKEV